MTAYVAPSMLASLASAFADISLVQLALIAGMALVASVIGGVAGYGTGALMPLVLVPIVGAEPVVPIIAISALLTNSSRIVAFRRLVDLRRALIVLATALPTCVLGAWGYTLLTGTGRAAGDRRHDDRERAVAPAAAAPRPRALGPRTGGGRVRLWRDRRRNRRRRDHPAVAA